jgi:hypothetical protein
MLLRGTAVSSRMVDRDNDEGAAAAHAAPEQARRGHDRAGHPGDAPGGGDPGGNRDIKPRSNLEELVESTEGKRLRSSS